jgi:hypothetical protein
MNPLLSDSALDIDKKSDIDPNSLLAWLRSRGNVEDRRKPHAAGTPDTRTLNFMLNGGGLGSPYGATEAEMLMGNLAGREQPQVMPGNGPEDQAWRMSMSDQFQGRMPTPHELAALRMAMEARGSAAE